ncbi:inositol monophosphatase family protein [Xanthomonas theicola]|uniref:3'(2'),5'-bisphosphate nucleotidase CysQ n=1 Tax=Xanthomonas theicola TaxID=56464 RepID=A0A2S6ZAI3_9XANT|nr:inositol monophosphatase family protein [Xanthomonas theicola]PPT79288.1 hypothetical protein XthCFBP4691_18880 [Xanthomonas theicola]QNH24117.1 3'(2'),5'-bisphosphate nucleotidase CysQ [Xanthomonas theicola]
MHSYPSIDSQPDLSTLLAAMVDVAHAAGRGLLQDFSQGARLNSRAELVEALRKNEDRSGAALRGPLASLRPGAAWCDDVPLPAGESWVVDAVEGNVNHVHGRSGWAVSITLLRDARPVAAVVFQPLEALTWTAALGAGAWLNGKPIRPSSKSDIGIAIATTGQAEAGQANTYRDIGRSVTAMLHRALLVRMEVPSTFPMLAVASGQGDVFWQYAPSLPGVAAGWLVVTEAGGTVSRIDGSAWTAGSDDILVCAPLLHASAVAALGAHAVEELA